MHNPHQRRIAKTVLLTLLLIDLYPVAAKKLYQYQDAHGAWVFSDKPPADQVPVQVKALPVREPLVKIGMRNLGTQEAPILAAVNEYYGPVEVEISGEQIENMRAEPALPVRRVIPARTEQTVLTLKPTGPAWRYGYRVRAMLGDPAAIHRPNQPYAPPFATGQSFAIGQAFGGAFSHQDPQSRYAVDLSLPLGTPVRAARAGVVMEVAGDFFDGGLDPRYQTRANAVRVLHEDGTMGVYAHLHPDSIRVSPGQRVEHGAWLANSGNTGFSSGPHLHFVIQRNAGMALVSVPFEFATANGAAITPAVGTILTAP